MKSEAAIVLVCQILMALTYAAGVRAITHFFSPDSFGTAALWIAAAVLIFQHVFMPLLQAHVRLYPEYNGAANFDRAILVYLRKLFAALLAVACVVVVVWKALDPSLAILWPLLVVVIIAAQVAFQYGSNILSASRQQGRLLIIRVGQTAVYPLCAVTAAYFFNARTVAVLLFSIAASHASAFLLFAFLRRTHAGGESPDLQDLGKKLWQYAAPFVPLALAAWLSSLGDRYIIAAKLDVAAVGIYAANYGLWSQPFLMLNGALTQWLRPILFEAQAANNAAQVRRALWLWSGLAVALGGAGGAIVWFARDFILGLLLDEKFHAADNVIAYILLAFSLYVLIQFLSHILLLRMNSRAQLWPAWIAAISNIAANLVLIPRMGLSGAALSTLLSFAVHGVVLGVQVLRTRGGGQLRAAG